MKFSEGNLEFEFPDALAGFHFDETKQNQPHFHGLSHCMKAVDFVIELEQNYLFLAVKDMFDPARYRNTSAFNHLKNVLVQKYRDTFLYRWAEDKLDKPVIYLCLIELENPIINQLTKEMQIHLPAGKPRNSPWSKPLAERCLVVNTQRWSRNFPGWPIRRITD